MGDEIMIYAAYGNSSYYQYENLLHAYSAATGFSNFLNLAILVLTIIGMWNMFNKAGEPGWGALIPYYRTYLLYKIADMKKAFWIYLAATLGAIVLAIVFLFVVVGAFVAMIGGNGSGAGIVGAFVFIWIFVFAAAITVLVLSIMLSINLAKVFNLSGGYAVGIFFLPFIFYMIIGLSKNIRYKNQFAGSQGFNGQGYGQNPYQQNPYQQNTYQQNPYGNPYQQNSYDRNPYGDPYQQNPYGQNNNGQETYAQNPYSETSYAQNAYDRNMNPQNAQNPQGQNPYAQPSKDDVWKTIYDDDSNNLNQ